MRKNLDRMAKLSPPERAQGTEVLCTGVAVVSWRCMPYKPRPRLVVAWDVWLITPGFPIPSSVEHGTRHVLHEWSCVYDIFGSY